MSFNKASKLLASHLSDLSRLNDGTLLRILAREASIDSRLLNGAQVFALSDTRAAVFTPNQATASRLRFESTKLRSCLKAKAMPRLQQLKVLVRKENPSPPGQPGARQAEVSSESIDQIEAVARQSSDPALTRAFERLASHMRNQKNKLD